MKFSQEVLKEISRSRFEPFWLQDQRESAWRTFETLPSPTVKDEEWKYTNLTDFQFSNFELSLEPQSSEVPFKSIENLPAHLRSLILSRDEEGQPTKWSAVMVQRNDTILYRAISSEIEKKGVIVCDLDGAEKKYPLLVDPILREIKNSSKSKFETLHQALWQEGVFIYVPKGVKVKEPVYNLVNLESKNTVIFPYTIVMVEEEGELTVIDEMVSENSSEKQFSNGYHYLKLKRGASLQYIQIQRWGSSVYHFDAEIARVAEGAKLNSVNVGLGSCLTKAHLHTLLEGRGAEAYPLGVFFGNGRQHFDIYTTQDHMARETQSDLLFKSALKDQAQSSYQGVIRIPREAQRSDAYQANKNLLLDPNAKARSIPKLEIIADDVRCTHSATVGTIEDDETFYLESRGLSHEDAVRMIVQGFFEQVFQKIPREEIRKRLHAIVKQKLEGGS